MKFWSQISLVSIFGLGLALAIAGCGSNSNNTSSSPTPIPVVNITPTPAPSATPAPTDSSTGIWIFTSKCPVGGCTTAPGTPSPGETPYQATLMLSEQLTNGWYVLDSSFQTGAGIGQVLVGLPPGTYQVGPAATPVVAGAPAAQTVVVPPLPAGEPTDPTQNNFADYVKVYLRYVQ